MTRAETTYTLDNTWERAHQRLTLLESLLDQSTISRLASLGVDAGWRCLELGAGAGSIARWLCNAVGATGTVTAVDLEPHFLEADPPANLDVHRRDIIADGIPGRDYDLIHARMLLMHLPGRDAVMADLVARLRPGGVILLEEGDLYPCATADSAVFSRVWERACAVAAGAGADWYWARHLPAGLVAAGAAGVASATESWTFAGGTPWAQLHAMTIEQLAPVLVADGLEAELLSDFNAELSDPGRWFPSVAAIAAWGHRPR